MHRIPCTCRNGSVGLVQAVVGLFCTGKELALNCSELVHEVQDELNAPMSITVALHAALCSLEFLALHMLVNTLLSCRRKLVCICGRQYFGNCKIGYIVAFQTPASCRVMLIVLLNVFVECCKRNRGHCGLDPSCTDSCSFSCSTRV